VVVDLLTFVVVFGADHPALGRVGCADSSALKRWNSFCSRPRSRYLRGRGSTASRCSASGHPPDRPGKPPGAPRAPACTPLEEEDAGQLVEHHAVTREFPTDLLERGDGGVVVAVCLLCEGLEVVDPAKFRIDGLGLLI